MFRKNPEIVRRKIHDSYFLIDITQNYLNDSCMLYEINEIGNFIWEQLEQRNNIEVIADKLFECLGNDVCREEVLKDIKEFIEILCQEGFMEVCNGRS